MYGSQIIMPYTLNLHSAVRQLYVNKTGRKKYPKEGEIQCRGDAPSPADLGITQK